MGIDYSQWKDVYEGMPLFANISAEDTVKLLQAMKPPLYTVNKGATIMDEYDSKYMYLCVSGLEPKWKEPRRSVWALPCGVDMVGVLCGEVMTLSGHETGVGPKTKIEPSPISVDYLLLSLDDMMEYDEAVWLPKKQMLRNLMGIVGQVVIETRALFYKARHGIDMYNLTEEEKWKYDEIHSDPLNQ